MATASEVLQFIVEIDHPGYYTNTIWLITSISENPARVRFHHNSVGGWWAYLLDVDGDEITVSIYDTEGREQILCGEIVSRPTTSEAAQ